MHKIITRLCKNRHHSRTIGTATCALYIGVNTGSRASSFELHSYVDSQFSFKFGLVSSQAHDIKRGSERVYPKCRVALQDFLLTPQKKDQEWQPREVV